MNHDAMSNGHNPDWHDQVGCELCQAESVRVRSLISFKAPSLGGRHEREWWVCDDCVDAFRRMLRDRRKERAETDEHLHAPYDWTLLINE